MAYNDVASAWKNPFKGQLFNVPSEDEGVNVYDESEIDY